MRQDHLRVIATDPDGAEREFSVRGQIARTLKALIDNNAQGVTSLDISATWALRTSHYVFVLRRDHGLDISMSREEHDGPSGIGWHGRYRLLTPVRIINEQPQAMEAPREKATA